jgi:hypothetical protein
MLLCTYIIIYSTRANVKHSFHQDSATISVTAELRTALYERSSQGDKLRYHLPFVFIDIFTDWITIMSVHNDIVT